MPEAAPRIYVDTAVYLDLLTQNTTLQKDTGQPRWVVAKGMFDAVNDDRVILAASALVEAEVCCIGTVRDGADTIIQRVRGWFDAESTLWTDVDRFLAREAARLAKEWHPFRADRSKKLGGADATHLAAAVKLGCSYLMTQDEGFPIGHTVDGVAVTRPKEVWPRHLLDEISSSDET